MNLFQESLIIFKIKIVIIYACLELDGKIADISTDYHIFTVFVLRIFFMNKVTKTQNPEARFKVPSSLHPAGGAAHT